MRFISYFIEDIKNIFNRPKSIGTLLALMILPGFYAWFNIIASWDPYGHTKNIQVAVTNNDIGTTIAGQNINIGNNVIHNLSENTNLGWTFVNEKTAREWVFRGNFYASIIIPKNFSENLMSFITNEPVKPKLEYIVNEKVNAIAPKITNSWINWLSEAITANFISSIYENVFERTNTFAEKIQSYEGDIEQAKNLVNKLSNDLPKIRDTLERWQNGIHTWKNILEKIPNHIDELDIILSKIIAETWETFSVSNISESISQSIIMQINLAEILVADAVSLSDSIHQNIEIKSDEIKPILQKSQNKLLIAGKILASIENFLNRLNTLTGMKFFSPIIEKVNFLHEKVANYLAINRKIYLALTQWEAISENILGELMTAGNKLNQIFADSKNFLNNSLPDITNNIDTFINNTIRNIHTESKNLQQELPIIKEKIIKIQEVLVLGNEKIEQILSHWTEIETGIQKIQAILAKTDSKQLASLLEIMLLNPENEKNFFKNPVEIETTSLFASPNYGSAIAPFFTTLALWTGALLSTSMLSVRSSKAQKEKNPRWWYCGRLILFLIIGLGQATIITLWNIFILDVYVLHPYLYLLMNILIVSIFQILIYSMVFLFGKIGSVLAIIVLLIQLSAGSGTFPVELTNEIFIKIHPYIPFTYAINTLREVSLGIVDSILWENIIILIVMLFVILISWIILSPYLSPLAEKFNKRTEWMDIFN